MNIQDEHSVFQDLDKKEQELFSAILSLQTHKDFFLKRLVEACHLNGDPKNVELLVKNFDNSWSMIKSTDSLRLWYDFVIQLLNKKISEEEDVVIIFYTISKDDKYQLWADDVINKHTTLIKSRNDFALANLGLVKSVVNGLKFNRKINIPKEDLIQEGYFGLMRAIEKFDQSKGLKFSTYAVWWIRHICQRHVFDKNMLIRTPAHTADVRDKIFEFESAYQKEHGQHPSDAEVQAGTGYSQLTMNTIAKPFKIFSIDKTVDIGEGEQVSLHEKLEDEESLNIFNSLEQNQMDQGVKKAIDTLSSREQKILFDRFGFNGCKEKSLQEIGKELKLSREGIRLIQIQALNKIKTILEKEGMFK